MYKLKNTLFIIICIFSCSKIAAKQTEEQTSQENTKIEQNNYLKQCGMNTCIKSTNQED